MRRVLIGLLVLAAALAAAPPAFAADRAASRWEQLAHAMAAPWPARQDWNGRFAEPTDELPGILGRFEGTRYGDAVMGYGLIATGVRSGDGPMVRAGIRAVSFATDPKRYLKRPSVFEQLAVASAYNLARRRLAGDPGFRRYRARWERFLRPVRMVRLQFTSRYGNHWLVDAVGVLELQRTGLRSRAARSVVGGAAASSRRLARQLINVRIPRLLAGRRTPVLSDAPDNPIPYHGLSLGLYARGVELLGRSAAPAARRVLRRGVRAAALMMAPNGSAAYFGRSQEEVWVPAGLAYGAAFTARLPGMSGAAAARAWEVAQRSLERLERDYPVGPGGAAIVPAVGRSLRPGWRALDAYAGSTAMGGLALMLLNWTLDDRPAARTRSALPLDSGLLALLSQDQGRFAVVRNGATWFAVRMARSRRFAGDLRYDAGLAYAFTRAGDGWRELVPQRPRTLRAPSAGPTLLRGGAFSGHDIDVRPGGRVRVSGAYGGGRAASVGYRAIPCGVLVSFAARAGDAFRVSAYFSGRPRLTPSGAADRRQRVSATADAIAVERVRGPYASGERARLRRVDITLRARNARRLGVRFCAFSRAGGTGAS